MRLAFLAGLLAPALLASPAFAAGGGAVAVTVPTATEAGTRAGTAPDTIARGSAMGEIAVTIDRAKVVRLPEGARTVIVGNPGIADLTVQKTGVVIVTGKSYGITNLIALDGLGNMLAESTLAVRAPNDTVLVVQRGPTDRQSYSCAPACLPSALLGDGKTYFDDNKAQIDRAIQSAQPK